MRPFIRSLTFTLGALLASAAVAKPIPTTCGAKDLLKELAAKEPEAHGKIVAAAKTVENGDGMLWRVEKSGLQPSWLFGTMHSTDPRLDRQVNRTRPLIARAKTVAVEISELVTPGLKDKAAQEIAAAGLARSGNALEALWPPANRAVVEAALLARGISADRAQRLDTWFLIVALSQPQCERERRALGLSSVDEKIGVAGARGGRSPVGLEKLEDQIAVLRRIGNPNPPLALIDTARRTQQIADMRETMTQAYIGDRLGELHALGRVSEILSGQPASAASASFTRSLLDDRNFVMRDNAKPLVERGGAFIAVGALHLPGPNGLVSLFRQLGYRVTVVK
ncbi:MAG: TraB/GumN family protein [Beijerinckiaceae bacterium]